MLKNPKLIELAKELRKSRQELPKATSKEAYTQQARSLVGITLLDSKKGVNDGQ